MPSVMRGSYQLAVAGVAAFALSACQSGSSTAANTASGTIQASGTAQASASVSSSSQHLYTGKRATPATPTITRYSARGGTPATPSINASAEAVGTPSTPTPGTPTPGSTPTATVTLSKQYKVTVKNVSEVLVPNLPVPDSDPDARCSPYTTAEAGALARKQIAPPTETSKNSWVSDDAISSFGCAPLNVVVIDNGATGADARYQIALFHSGFYVGTPLSKPLKEHPNVTVSLDGVIQFVDESTATHGATMTTTADPLGEEHEYPEGTTVNYYVWDSHSGKVLLTHDAPQLAN